MIRSAEQVGELAVGEADAVEGLEFLAEVLLQRGAVGDVLAVVVSEAEQIPDEGGLDGVFPDNGTLWFLGEIVGEFRGWHCVQFFEKPGWEPQDSI